MRRLTFFFLELCEELRLPVPTYSLMSDRRGSLIRGLHLITSSRSKPRLTTTIYLQVDVPHGHPLSLWVETVQYPRDIGITAIKTHTKTQPKR